MSNFENENDKLTVYLIELQEKHRKLDNEIKELYTHFEKDEIINRLKTQKLWLKDEIHRIESRLATLGLSLNGS